MKNLLDGLNKYVVVALYILLVVSIVNGCNGCSHNKENVRLKRQVDSLKTEVSTLRSSTYDKKELDLRMSIEGYEISKRMLYDNNAIVRTSVRPDDRMNQYDKEIGALREKLQSK